MDKTLSLFTKNNFLSRIKTPSTNIIFNNFRKHISRNIYTLPSPSECRSQLSKPVQDLVKDYSSVTNIDLQWGEQDAFGHLNNASFLRFFESGRIAFYFQLIDPNLSKNSEFGHGITKIGPIVKTVKCDYKLPVTYPDNICVATRIPIESIGKNRYTVDAIMVSRKLEKIVAKSEVVVVTYDYRIGKKADIPSDYKELLVKLEKNKN
ncbi:hypothetical protein BCR32DRAFT_326543 [Anaeromyces robustus]|uniref:Thioesterase/thiol ester dehydrase-isomerase n=1 Tax=Anaeromyces robustus TaxID=1754192 RepID=A0A1Y1XBH1_9FUNG|nr:hypothetical protein BCR32DRAFT_326543 [Anaeromyces robustus]|eukprot:ORX83110.1 hypothetical protein BCR32DRAFT_326543 [Anaeromyces robustus]